MVDVVPERDIFAEKLLAHAAGEAGALVEHGGAGEIVEEETDEIEDGGRLENRGVMARARVRADCASRPLCGWRFRQALRGSISRMSGELALAQPEEFSSRIVTENSARVCS